MFSNLFNITAKSLLLSPEKWLLTLEICSVDAHVVPYYCGEHIFIANTHDHFVVFRINRLFSSYFCLKFFHMCDPKCC